MEIIELIYTEIIPAGLFIIMIGMGLSLTLGDIRRVIVYPRAASIGLIGQLVFLPLLAFLLIFLLQPAPVVAIGIVILAACPGGITSNAYVFASRGDVALSVTLTAISSFVTVFTIPLYTTLATGMYLDTGITPDLDATAMMLKLAQLTILPITIGMIIRAWQPEFAKRSVEVTRIIALVFLVVLIGGSTLLSMDEVLVYFMDAALIAFLLNIITMVTAFGVARLFRLENTQVVSITFEIGVQNLALAMTVALAIMQEPLMGMTALIYGIFMKMTALGFLVYARKLTRDQEELSVART